MSDLVYYGVWINWSRGSWDGSTITLTPRDAGVLVAFLAIFVSVAGGSLWRIIAFFLHQHRVSKTSQDGLHFQQQAILRNAATPGVASWQLLWLIPPWRRLSNRPFWRSLPLVFLALLNLGVFFAAGILVAEVTRTAGSEVLVRSPNCGNWTMNTTTPFLGFTSKTLNDTVSSATYSRACYGGKSDSLECNRYQVQSLPYTKTENVTCPFADGMCLRSFPAFTLDTGNLSSHDHLGINTQPKDRIHYRRTTTCAPLIDLGYITSFNYTDAKNASIGDDFRGRDGDVMDFYNFGPMIKDDSMVSNYTYAYNRGQAAVGYGYSLASVDYAAGHGNENRWRPDKSLLRNDGDISLMFLAANDLLYYGTVEDPIFNATVDVKSVIDDGKNITLYTSNFFVNPFGCVDQHQFCNPENNKCTKLDSYLTAVRSAQTNLQMNPMQYGIVSTLSLDLYLSIISQSIGGRGSAALRAQEVVSGLFSGPLPGDQWKREVEYWFNTGLSKLQRYFVEYATGPLNVLEGTFVSKPFDAASRQLCDSQKIKAPAGSNATSFSTLGVAIILGVGGLLIFTHGCLEYIVANVIASRNHKLVRWALDEKLQLQRLAFEGAGIGTWKDGIGTVPTTTSHQLLGMQIGGGKDHPTMNFGSDDGKEHGDVMMRIIESPTMSSTSKDSEDRKHPWSVRSQDSSRSIQIPPIRMFDGDREVWPLVQDRAEGGAEHQISQGGLPYGQKYGDRDIQSYSYR